MSPNNQRKEYSTFELMNMTRHQRRALGKANGIKIPGIPHDVLQGILKERDEREFTKEFIKEDAKKESILDHFAESDK